MSCKIGINDHNNNRTKKNQEKKMQKYVCDPCGYVYDPREGDSAGGAKPGTAFADLPPDWVCPVCGAGKEQFSAMN